MTRRFSSKIASNKFKYSIGISVVIYFVIVCFSDSVRDFLVGNTFWKIIIATLLPCAVYILLGFLVEDEDKVLFKKSFALFKSKLYQQADTVIFDEVFLAVMELHMRNISLLKSTMSRLKTDHYGVVLVLARELLVGELLSGQYHIYRGILSSTSGMGMLFLFYFVLDELYDNGYINEESKNEMRGAVDEEIKHLG